MYPFDEPVEHEAPPRTESEGRAALRRAGVRAVYHLLRAGVEGLKAVEAVVDELGRARRPRDEPPDEGRVRIEVE